MDYTVPSPESIAASGEKRPLLPLGAMTGSTQFLTEVSQNLVDVFGTMLERPLKLVHGPHGCTDTETFISVPLHQYDAYLVTEHELSHCLFGTNKKLTEDFQIVAVERLLRRAGLTLTSPDAVAYKPMLEKTVHMLWNVLEDRRCCGLWTQLYPGGGSLLQTRWHDISTYEYEDADCEKNLLQFLARYAAGVDTPTAVDFQACKGPMQKALNLVEGVDAAACLAITARLIDEIADELLDNNPPPEKQKAAQEKLKALQQATAGNPTQPKGQEDGTPPPTPSKEEQKQAKKNSVNGLGEDDAQVPISKKNKVDAAQRVLINRLLTAKTNDAGEEDDGQSSFARLLNAGAEKMEDRLEEAKLAMAMPKKSIVEQEREVLVQASKDARIQVVFAEPVTKLPKASPAAEKIRQHLEKVRMRQRKKLREDGDELETEAYLEARLGGEDLCDSKFFQQRSLESGLELLLLFDCSGSMSGGGLAMVEKAAADAVHACDGPKITVHMWGYSDQLFVFKKVGSPVGAKGMYMGGTCMVQALEVASEWARASKSTRAIIHMTDGMPTSCRARKSSGNALEDLRSVLDEMRKDGVVLSNLAIGPKQYKDMYEQGFGPGGYTLLSGISDLKTALPDTAKKLVEAHLKRGR